MTFSGGGDGELGFTVWPAYAGLVNANLGTPPFSVVEPSNDPNYERGQIYWEYRSGQVVGRARITCPAGDYTHVAYFQHPTDQRVTGLRKLPHPICFIGLINTLDLDPIYNDDLELNVPVAPP